MELPGILPYKHWVREMKRHGLLSQDFVADGSKDLDFYFDVDEQFYRMFWARETEVEHQ